MISNFFTEFKPTQKKGANFEDLLNVFMQLINATAGDVGQALSWLNNLDRRYNFTSDEYGIGDFVEDLKEKGYIKEEQGQRNGEMILTAKSEQHLRKSSLEELFGKLKKSKTGNHKQNLTGKGDETVYDLKSFQFGDSLENISVSESLRNAQLNHGLDEFFLTEEDLEIHQKESVSQTSTVLMIDISHSMILYGEDRITPAKKTAMALAELIKTKYPKDTLDIIVFGNDAWQIQIKDLPYLEVGPYHTNTVAGLELAIDLLRRRKTNNKQIFMITDGKPTCLKVGLKYYKNSFGLDKKILNKTLNLEDQCIKSKITITTFMIATDSYLQEFVREFTKVNQGKAYFSDLDELGSFIFEDFKRNKRKSL
ncbi:MAG: VWA domain-containing protein [Cytophagales bacterium]